MNKTYLPQDRVIDIHGNNPRSQDRKRSTKSADSSVRTNPQVHQAVSHEQVAKMAYAMWQKHGSQDGVDVETWLNAEQELKKDQR